jgi:DNA-directed RNA polymerase subunit RPC12/RpoP
MTSVLVECPNPSCPGRSVEGDQVNREHWNATWHEVNENDTGFWGPDIFCPAGCSEEGIDPESGQLDSAEEELGMRCGECGIVSERFTELDKEGNEVVNRCPHCGRKELPA